MVLSFTSLAQSLLPFNIWQRNHSSMFCFFWLDLKSRVCIHGDKQSVKDFFEIKKSFFLIFNNNGIFFSAKMKIFQNIFLEVKSVPIYQPFGVHSLSYSTATKFFW